MTSNGVPFNQPPDPSMAAAMDEGLPPEPFPAPHPEPGPVLDADADPNPIRFPNTRRRRGSADSSDNKNTPFNTPHTPKPTSTSYSDPDTCRICRAEGSREEPLFYPCKCSGSIKYVHQDCLMEWLSHSQKKHCELCKTPFRFTKLYDPNMPKALPAYVFLRHTTKYIFRNLLVWLRAVLVISVWLGWLPYMMRSVWSCLFWISDEGLLGGRSGFFGGGWPSSVGDNGLGWDGLADALLPFGAGAVCPASPLLAPTTTPVGIGGLLNSLPPESAKLVRTLYGINLTSSDPIYSTFLRLLFGSGGLSSSDTVFTGSYAHYNVNNTSTRLPEPERDTLLSGVNFIRNLTSSQTINRIITDILEGQIITLLVIVCFILIILVRDYVVQQQPEINMRAAFAAAGNQPQADAVEPGHGDIGLDEEHHFGDFPLGLAAHHRFDDSASETIDGDGPSPFPDHIPNFMGEPSSGSGSGSQPVRAFPPGSNFRPAVLPESEGQVQDFDRATVHEYLAIYREAGGDAERIMMLAQERGLEMRLDYWLRLTRSMMARQREAEQTTGPSDSVGQGQGVGNGENSSLFGAPAQWSFRDANGNGTGNEDGHRDADRDRDLKEDETRGILGGRIANPLRPRAHTDGPPINNTINPLANNNWSFAELPPAAPSSGASGSQPPMFLGADRPVEPERAFPAWDPSEDVPEPVTHTIRPPTPPREPLAAVPTPTTPAAAGAAAAPTLRPALVPAAPRRPGFAGRIADFMWRDVENLEEADLAPVNVVGDFAEDDPDDDVHGNNGPPPPPNNNAGDDAAAGAAAAVAAAAAAAAQDGDAADMAAAGLDAEAMEDAEDLEGILELLGMRGPISGLFQNAIFCAFLVSMTICLGVFVPYNIGRGTIWVLANPYRIARMVFGFWTMVQDLVLLALGAVATAACEFVRVILGQVLRVSFVAKHAGDGVRVSWAIAKGAAGRIGSSFVSDLPLFSAAEVRNFSAVSHEALFSLKASVGQAVAGVGHGVGYLLGGDYARKGAEVYAVAGEAWGVVKEFAANPNSWNPSSWNLSLQIPSGDNITKAIDPDLAHWNGMDRFWAVLAGYASFASAAALYLRHGLPFSSSSGAQEWEASLVDVLTQASGVLKVILIISIEMLVFPLYCGLLLDIALLPLFEAATFSSRLRFTLRYPLTSIFVHWFLGTAYMFHFALFVSMCRKIMRKGVLYFIRDPDDPEFHPVRDVLERNVTTQLRKILFSAFVYGALVIVCLGGVVWGLWVCIRGVLPIHYASNEPVLEFPLDLLFYNFVMPFAVRVFQPSHALHAMNTWWFRRCARALRITWFLFGERRMDEEGVLVLAEDSPDRALPFWRRCFLEIDRESGRVVARSWRGIFEAGIAKPISIQNGRLVDHNAGKAKLVRTGELIENGRFVRTPASDQVKIPKGTGVFLPVDENNRRIDANELDGPSRGTRPSDIYSTKHYQIVYVPPHFRLRVFAFILYIWIFAAITGVTFTIVPLVFGRWMLRQLIPAHIRTNDVYAFSLGVHVLGSAVYALFHARSIYASVKHWAVVRVGGVVRDSGVLGGLKRATERVLKVVYTYAFVLVVAPLMTASLLELYLLIPLNEIMYGMGTFPLVVSNTNTTAFSSTNNTTLNPANIFNATTTATPLAELQPTHYPSPPHTIRLVQSWTIGLLYLKLATRFINTCFRGSRLSNAARAVLRRGWLDPDVRILTRCFVLPALVAWIVAVTVPLGLAAALVRRWAPSAEHIVMAGKAVVAVSSTTVYRLSYPIVAGVVNLGWFVWKGVGVWRGWRVRIRDEAYLIGERLHNFGGRIRG
ncbi:uncharacterized protein C8A04DRAFT_14923 [Dichotomopilus funicola]|uniref:RING-type E3 ubiquitin transferase n=1 Tax=Dichotomopilus funicola TaxID=1934379 RepID=A0AAN6UXT9_9PEZI|nr:hypothetical protein C8A04DRAFT_14923 [Dichotomopilus funicola]